MGGRMNRWNGWMDEWIDGWMLYRAASSSMTGWDDESIRQKPLHILRTYYKWSRNRFMLQQRQLNWYFSLSALIYDHTVNKMTSHMIHICHMQNADDIFFARSICRCYWRNALKQTTALIYFVFTFSVRIRVQYFN